MDKTKLCRFYHNKNIGFCDKGVYCPFIHELNESKIPCDKEDKYKTEFCSRFYLQNNCFLKEKCPFIHAVSECKNKPGNPLVGENYCEDFMKYGSCRLGTKICKKQHVYDCR